MGAIRGQRLPAETKLGLVRAVEEAKRAGATVAQACQVLKLSRTRLYWWVRGKGMEEVQVADLEDKPPVAQVVRHRITPAERKAILEMAQEEQWADLRHCKLAHMLGRLRQVFASESTVLWILKAAKLVVPPLVRRRSQRQKPEVKADGPNQVWRWDISYVAVGVAFWYLVAILDQYSRKIVGWGKNPQPTSSRGKAGVGPGPLLRRAPGQGWGEDAPGGLRPGFADEGQVYKGILPGPGGSSALL